MPQKRFMPTSGVTTMHEDLSHPRVMHASGRGRLTTISTSELCGRLSDPEQTIIDVRPLPAFNGWRLAGEVRGGHIPGAVAFPSAWLTRVDDAALVRLLRAKNVVAGRELPSLVAEMGEQPAPPEAGKPVAEAAGSTAVGRVSSLNS